MEIVDEKRNKRAAANVNERRRMQNINCGFEALRDLIDVPNKTKLSKSAILRHSVEMLRNMISENQQLREQNIFLRNLHGNNMTINISTNQDPHSPAKSNQITDKSRDHVLSHNEIGNKESVTTKQQKKVRLDTSMLSFNEFDNNNTPTKNFYDSYHSPIRKSPRRSVSKHESPKVVNRSTVITENYTLLGSTYPVFESPTRRSLRLQEKEKHYLTPPSSMNTSLDSYEGFKMEDVTSPATRSRSVAHSEGRIKRGFIPEKNIQPKNARRSLDVIIQAIDHLEKS